MRTDDGHGTRTCDADEGERGEGRRESGSIVRFGGGGARIGAWTTAREGAGCHGWREERVLTTVRLQSVPVGSGFAELLQGREHPSSERLVTSISAGGLALLPLLGSRQSRAAARGIAPQLR